MNLNGQCEIAFNEWYNHIDYVDLRMSYESFLLMPHAMQHGVKVKFFDSEKIYINTWNVNQCSVVFTAHVNKQQLGFFTTREEAQTKAEQKANDIYNENN